MPGSDRKEKCRAGFAVKVTCAALVAYGVMYGATAAVVAEREPEPVAVRSAEPVIVVQTPEPVEVVEEEYAPMPATDFDEEDLKVLAQTVYGEARGCSMTEQAAVIWCILNRVDSDEFPDTIQEVVKQPGHFVGYDPNHPVDPVMVELARDVLNRWENNLEGRVLPKEYLFFHGDGKTNYFRTEFRGAEGYWDWSLESPYDLEKDRGAEI